MRHSIGQEINGVLVFLAAIWAVFLLEYVVPIDWVDYGVVPRTWSGLIGIPAMPFLHADLGHIVSNTLPLFVLLILLAGSQANSWQVVLGVVLLGGALLWLCGRHANHIGASGLVFGLMAFLIVSGVLERRFVPLVVAVVVTFVYGGSLLSGVMPRVASRVSWDGHLCGAVAGAVVAYLATRTNPADKSD